MKFMSLMIPAYLPRPYPSATPIPHMSGTVDAFERKLTSLSGYVIRHGNHTRLLPDPNGRFVVQQIVTRYDLMVDPSTSSMGDAIVLALKAFTLDKVSVVFTDSDAVEVSMPEALEIQSMLHPWCEVAANEQA